MFGRDYFGININWKFKSCVFSLIDLFRATPLLYFIQKYVTRRSSVEILSFEKVWQTHLEVIECIEKPKMFEFGAGKNLAQNIFLSQVCAEQVVVDLNRMADIKQVNQAASQMVNFIDGFVHTPIKNFQNLIDFYHIDYKAPLDASATYFPDNYFDVCCSTNTLEHIPFDMIEKIFDELRRILKSGGKVSALIDYSDHYAHTDPSISMLNFLKFSDHDWSRYNHSCHFQNRLRHFEYEAIFIALGFKVLKSEPYFSGCLELGDINDKFDTLRPSLTATSGYFLLENVSHD